MSFYDSFIRRENRFWLKRSRGEWKWNKNDENKPDMIWRRYTTALPEILGNQNSEFINHYVENCLYHDWLVKGIEYLPRRRSMILKIEGYTGFADCHIQMRFNRVAKYQIKYMPEDPERWSPSEVLYFIFDKSDNDQIVVHLDIADDIKLSLVCPANEIVWKVK